MKNMYFSDKYYATVFFYHRKCVKHFQLSENLTNTKYSVYCLVNEPVKNEWGIRTIFQPQVICNGERKASWPWVKSLVYIPCYFT